MIINERDSEGLCTLCNWHVDKGPNLDCPQCCCDRRNNCLTYAQKVRATADRLRVKGARVRIKRRKLASGWKTYLQIIDAGGTLNTWNLLVLPLIHLDFPEAYMTSGAFSLSGPDPHMTITVSLDPRTT